jgi:Predicted dienelactone hydrolase
MRRKLPIQLVIVLAAILLASCATLYRRFQFPPADGAYAVGSKAVELVDEGRPEPYAKGAPRPRDIMIQIWYPAEPSSAKGKEPLAYGPEIEEVLREVGGKLGAGFSYLHAVPTSTYEGLPPARSGGPFPVLLFSPGNLSTRFQSMAQVTNLASRGYVVIGVDHPYTSAVVLYPDGRKVRESDKRSDAFDRSSRASVDEELQVRVDDLKLALAYAERIDIEEGSPFSGCLDLSRLGAFGHSLGGATALQFAAEEPRVKAVFSEEGGVWGSVVDTGIRVPLLYMQASKTLESETYSASGIKSDEASNEAFASFRRDFVAGLTSVFTKTEADRYYLAVKGFNHLSFSDAPLYSDYFARPIGNARSIALVNDYLDAFFGRYLRGEGGELLNGPSGRYAEVGYKKNSSELFPATIGR